MRSSIKGGEDGAVVLHAWVRWTGIDRGLRNDVQGSLRAADASRGP